MTKDLSNQEALFHCDVKLLIDANYKINVLIIISTYPENIFNRKSVSSGHTAR